MKYSINGSTVERWGMFEIRIEGKTEGNPFTDYDIRGVFRHKNETVNATGFYDGDGIYKVRCMPSFEGEYTFEIDGNCIEDKVTGGFLASAASKGNHGPVRVANTYHFAYEDGTPYRSIGTTCYAWTHQSKELRDQTLETLSQNAFNKIRFCIFPKHYIYNFRDPETFPYEGTPCDSSVLTEDNFNDVASLVGNEWDFTRFNPIHFQRFEQYIVELMKLGIEADIIVMHPYDRWGFSRMSQREDDLYWNYVVNRLSAYRNVWWSLANEHDFMREKTVADWERYAAIICRQDPYNHLRSIHNGTVLYDHSRPWITHCSIQRVDIYKTAELTGEIRQRYQKPVVLDEICYEGNIDQGWGNITGEELVRRFWEGMCNGGYPGHGETYIHPKGILWWSHGGQLHGKSPKRIEFLAKIMSETPGCGLKPVKIFWDCTAASAEGTTDDRQYLIVYFGFTQPSFRVFHLDDDTTYQVEIIDTWDMTIKDAGQHKGKMRIELPAKQYIAVRFRKVQ